GDAPGRDQHARPLDEALVDRIAEGDVGVARPLVLHVPHGREAGPERRPASAAPSRARKAWDFVSRCWAYSSFGASRIIRWVWQSMRPGSTVAPSSSIVSASAGMAPPGPTSLMRSPSTRMSALGIGVALLPSRSRPARIA